MHLKVFVKLKKNLETLSSGQKTPQKNQKKPTGLVFFFFLNGFFQPWLERNDPDLDENGLDPVEGAEVHRHVGEGLLLPAPASHWVQPSKEKKV